MAYSSSPRTWKKCVQNTGAYPWFDWMKNGKINKHCRIYRNDWKEMKVNDIIYFTGVVSNRYIKTKINGITIFSTFNEAFKRYDKEMVPYERLIPEIVDMVYDDLYTKDEDKLDLLKYGVIVLDIEVLEE